MRRSGSRAPRPAKSKTVRSATPKHFRVEIRPVDGFVGLCAVLTELTEHSYSFVIRGAPLPGINLAHTRRLLHPDRKTW